MPNNKSTPPFSFSQPAPDGLPANGRVTAIIADDEPNIARHLEQMLLAIAPEIEVLAVVHDGESALRETQARKPSLLFLDIKMPGPDGIEVAWRCRDLANIIFVTAYEQHAVTAFEQGVVDYLRKPINPERLRQAVERFYQRGRVRGVAVQKRYIEFLHVNDGDHHSVSLIPAGEVLYIEAMGNYCCVHRINGSQGNLRYTLTQLMEGLDPDVFLQIHRGCIVNRNRIKSIVRQGHGAIVQLRDCDTELRASRQYAAALTPM